MNTDNYNTINAITEQEIKNHPIKSTLFFWLCVFIGPFILGLITYFSYTVMWLDEGLIFEITVFIVALIAQAASCFFGYSIAFHYSPKSNVPMVNGILCIIMLAVITYNSLHYANYTDVISYVLGIISLIFCIMQKDNMTDILEQK